MGASLPQSGEGSDKFHPGAGQYAIWYSAGKPPKQQDQKQFGSYENCLFRDFHVIVHWPKSTCAVHLTVPANKPWESEARKWDEAEATANTLVEVIKDLIPQSVQIGTDPRHSGAVPDEPGFSEPWQHASARIGGVWFPGSPRPALLGSRAFFLLTPPSIDRLRRGRFSEPDRQNLTFASHPATSQPEGAVPPIDHPTADAAVPEGGGRRMR